NQFPTFKSKYDRQSFRVPQRVRIEADKLIIPKFRGGIKVVVNREIEGEIKFATISKTTTGKYYASITCEVQHQPYDKTGSSVGIDTGIKDLAILSNGQTYKNIRSLKTQLKKVKYAQRQLSKKTKGSQSRQRQKRKLALVHEKVANIRRDYLQKVTTDIIKNHDVISIEDLAVKNILKNHHLAGAMSDVSLGSFYTLLAYKAAWHDRTIVKIDRFYPSSKTCSSCGWKKEDLTLSDRTWTCRSCGTTHDRDLNAAKNILQQGIKILSGYGSYSDEKQKRGEASLLSESMNPEALLTAWA
ncbi:MAG: RNA-guided endonuclease TnpB family protein, partial [Sphingobacterium sp.]